MPKHHIYHVTLSRPIWLWRGGGDPADRTASYQSNQSYSSHTNNLYQSKIHGVSVSDVNVMLIGTSDLAVRWTITFVNVFYSTHTHTPIPCNA